MPLIWASSRTRAFGPVGSRSTAWAAALFDRLDLLADQAAPLQQAVQPGQRVGRQRLTLNRAQGFQMLRGLLQARLEALDAPQRQLRLDRVGHPGAFGDQPLALASRSPGILLGDRRDRHHPAVPRLAAQPAEQRAHQHLGVKPVGLGPALLTRHRDAAGVNDINLNPVSLEQPGQPEPVTPGFIRHHRARDRPTGPRRLLAPALDLLEQARRVDRQLLQRPPVHSRHRRRHQPGRAAHLDHAHQRAVMVESDERVWTGRQAWTWGSSISVNATMVPQTSSLAP